MINYYKGRTDQMSGKSANPILQALGAAILFGASAPLSKILLQDIEPIMLAGLLYLGSGVSAVLLRFFRLVSEKELQIEADLSPHDIPWLAGAVIAGGIIGPILLANLILTPTLMSWSSMITAILIRMFTTSMSMTGGHRKRRLPMHIGILTYWSCTCMRTHLTCTTDILTNRLSRIGKIKPALSLGERAGFWYRLMGRSVMLQREAFFHKGNL